MNNNIIDDANNIAVQRLLSTYLFDVPRYATGTYAGTTIIIEPSRHRTGLPDDATSTRYTFIHLEEGWAFRVRSVWLDGALLVPAATHTRIEEYHDNHARYGTDEHGVSVAVNSWFRRQDNL